MHSEQSYLELLDTLASKAQLDPIRKDRTGTGTYSIFGAQSRHRDVHESFPLLTTKKVHWKSVVHELIWFLSGSTNTKYLRDNGVKIWNEWANEYGELGPVYGHQWRAFGARKIRSIAEMTPYGEMYSKREYTPGVDQIAQVIQQIKDNPLSRRHIVSAWNPGEVDQMALPPCHTLFQFYVRPEEGKIDLQLYQRSADIFLGVPFNIASYSLLLMMVAQVTGYEAGDFVHTFGDVHLYSNHTEQAKLQLSREPRKLPTVRLSPGIDNINDFTAGDVILLDYDPHPRIKAKVAV